MKQAQYTKSLTIALPSEHHEQIKRITDEQKISMAEWTREVVAAALETNQEKVDKSNDE